LDPHRGFWFTSGEDGGSVVQGKQSHAVGDRRRDILQKQLLCSHRGQHYHG
jgi:hypothetical protein